MMADVLALAMLVSLILYAVSGGADFGGGVWDLFAFGSRAERQRQTIERAIAPVWEANHVWLILLIVILFTAFPHAFAEVSIALHVPLTLMLLGIVFRGSAFVFRHYGGGDPAETRRWGRVFAISSAGTPIFLGMTIGAITGRSWHDPFSILVGLFTLALFAFLAAVYLTNEPNDPELAGDFRRRALIAGVAVGMCALAAGMSAPHGTERFFSRLFGSWWSWPLQITTGLSAIITFGALILRRFRAARAAAISQVTLILLGWGAAQYPVLVPPSLTIATAAAPEETLELLLVALVIGSLVLFPSLYWMLKIFKSQSSS